MRILFDYQAFSMQRYGGISRYFSALSSHLASTGEDDGILKLLHSENGYLTPQNHLLPYPIGHFLLKKKSRMERWNRRYYQFLLRKNNFDVFHPTYYDPYFLPYLNKPYVITVHDMIHELFPEYFYPHDATVYHKRRVIEQANHIIAISASTKHDLQQIYNIPERKISVIHHGLFHLPYAENANSEIKVTDDANPYILYMGDRETYKNFYRFTVALSRVMTRYVDIRLICAGGGPLKTKEQEHLKRLKILDRVKQITVTDIQLSSLYNNAMFFCYPSLYEGFGLPILEAFASHCPVAVSNTSCFTEVGGDAVVYFNPYDIEEMEKVFQLFIEDTQLRSSLKTRGATQLKLFSLKTCMEKTMDCYRQLSNS